MKGCPEKLRSARVRAKLSQESLASGITERLNPRRPVHVTTISRIENGHLPLRDLSFVVAWAGECGVGDFRELLDDAELDDEDAALMPLLRSLQDMRVGDFVDLLNDLRPSKKEGIKQ